eukprot:586660-Rhodomonas_salina.1
MGSRSRISYNTPWEPHISRVRAGHRRRSRARKSQRGAHHGVGAARVERGALLDFFRHAIVEHLARGSRRRTISRRSAACRRPFASDLKKTTEEKEEEKRQTE